MSSQKELFLYNRARIHPRRRKYDSNLLDFEKLWIDPYLDKYKNSLEKEFNWLDLQNAFSRLIESELEPVEASIYVEENMTLDEFRIFVQEFAVDGLTEAQVFYYIFPRLSLAAQMPLFRIMIDEFGAGNLKNSHTMFYVQLLTELKIPTDYHFYLSHIDEQSFAFLNLFYWLTLRADDPSYFAGAITYFETVIPNVFESYTRICARLGIANHQYYSEHQHIDVFHAVEGKRLLKIMHHEKSLDANKTWFGVQLASEITNDAFDNAVNKAQELGQLNYA